MHHSSGSEKSRKKERKRIRCGCGRRYCICALRCQKKKKKVAYIRFHGVPLTPIMSASISVDVTVIAVHRWQCQCLHQLWALWLCGCCLFDLCVRVVRIGVPERTENRKRKKNNDILDWNENRNWNFIISFRSKIEMSVIVFQFTGNLTKQKNWGHAMWTSRHNSVQHQCASRTDILK